MPPVKPLLITAATLGAFFSLTGCVSTLASVVTAPVRAASQVVDWSTTSQSESDRNRGQRLREREADIGRLSRRRDRQAERCDNGNRNACEEKRDLDEQIAELRDRPV